MPRDYLAEAREIVAGTSLLLPAVPHLQAAIAALDQAHAALDRTTAQLDEALAALQRKRNGRLTRAELATLIAALRIFQRTNAVLQLHEMSQFEHHKPLTWEQIDDLCARLTYGAIAQVEDGE
jgi:hypothetical protein